MYKAGYVSIVGKPSSGKSSLINKMVGYKVAITAPKPQTTRFNIKGIVTSETSQIIFIDTPGVHKPENVLGENMMKSVSSAVRNSNVVLYLVDATKPKIDEASERIMEYIKSLKTNVILAINKIDKVKKEKILEIITQYNNKSKEIGFEFSDIVPISVFKSDGLDILVKVIEKYLDESEKIFEDDEFTDITEREIVSENIREKLLKNLDEEVPHGVNVVIDEFKERVNINGDQTYDVVASIICKKQSHKPIIIGKNGSRLNHIRNLAKLDLENILGVKMNLKIWVKVREDWMDNEVYQKNIKKAEK